MVGCYIIHSKHLNRFYIGAVQDDLEARILKHNDHIYGKHRFTAKASDWKLFQFIECDSYTQSICIERYIKSMKSSIFIENLSKHPEIINRLKLKCKSI
jgi:putative endonuclease